MSMRNRKKMDNLKLRDSKVKEKMKTRRMT